MIRSFFFLQRLIGMWPRSVLVIVDFRVSSNYTPSSPKKRGQNKRKHLGKDCEKAVDSKVYEGLDIVLCEVLF